MGEVTLGPPAGAGLGRTPRAGRRPACRGVAEHPLARCLLLSDGERELAVVTVDAALLDAATGDRIRQAAAAAGRTVLVVATGLAATPAAVETTREAWGRSVAPAAATAVRLASLRRAPALLRLGSASLPGESAAPHLAYLDAVWVEALDGSATAALVNVPCPAGQALGETADRAGWGRVERAVAAALDRPVALLPLGHSETAPHPQPLSARGEGSRSEAGTVGLASAVLAAWEARGGPLRGALTAAEGEVVVRTLPLPSRQEAETRQWRAEFEAESGGPEADEALAGAAWLARVTAAATAGPRGELSLPVARLALGEVELVAVGAALAADVAVSLVERAPAETTLLVAEAGGRRGLVTRRPTATTLLDPAGLEPLTDLWPWDTEAVEQVLEAMDG